jgi:hypothetical protein
LDVEAFKKNLKQQHPENIFWVLPNKNYFGAVPTGIELAVRNFPVRLSMKFKFVFNVHTDIVVKIYSI